MTDVNHLQEAKERMGVAEAIYHKFGHKGRMMEHRNDAQAHALIAIAEEQGKITHDNVAFQLILSTMNSHLVVIAEQLEKMNAKLEPEIELVEVITTTFCEGDCGTEMEVGDGLWCDNCMPF